MSRSFATLLDDSKVVVCCGSGGVGKTTTAAALALAAARRGRRVVLITIDPAKRLADALGIGALSNEPTPVTATDGTRLWAMMLDARTTFDDVIRTQSRDEAQARRILGNSFYVNIASKLSGSQEYMAAEKLYQLTNDDRFDLVVVDTPPTREALDFLEAPQKLMNFLDHRVYRWMVAPARGGLKVLNLAAQPILRTIGRVIGADVLADAIDFFQAFEGIEPGFVRRAAAVQDLLKSSDCRYVVVSSARRDTVGEAVYFVGRLEARNVRVAGLVVNRLQPSFGKGAASSAETAARKATDPTDALLQKNLAHLRRIAEAEKAVIAPLVTRVSGAAVARVHQRATDVHDLASIDALGHEIVG